MDAQPRRLVGEQPERGAVRLGEAEAGEALDHREHPLGRVLVDAVQPLRAGDEALVVGLDRRLGALAAHRPPQSLRLAGREAGERDRDLQHLVLEDDRPERLAQHRLERGVLVGDLVAGIDAQPLAPLDVRIDRAALDRPGTDDRDLDRDVLEVLGPGPAQRLHLRAALDLEDPRRVGVLDALVGLGIVVGDPGQIDALASRPRDQLDAALDRREHPQTQQVDLQEAGVRAGVLVPLDDLAALHRGGHDRAAVDQRPGGDDHPARVLGEVARESVRLGRQTRQPGPAAAGAAASASTPWIPVARARAGGRAVGRPIARAG